MPVQELISAYEQKRNAAIQLAEAEPADGSDFFCASASLAAFVDVRVIEDRILEARAETFPEGLAKLDIALTNAETADPELDRDWRMVASARNDMRGLLSKSQRPRLLNLVKGGAATGLMLAMLTVGNGMPTGQVRATLAAATAIGAYLLDIDYEKGSIAAFYGVPYRQALGVVPPSLLNPTYDTTPPVAMKKPMPAAPDFADAGWPSGYSPGRPSGAMLAGLAPQAMAQSVMAGR